MLSMIRVLRALDLLPGMDALIPEVGPRPLDFLKLEGKVRKRAYSSKHQDKEKGQKWTWGDDA